VQGDKFERSDSNVPKRKEFYDRINNWIFGLGIEQVGDFTDSLFKLVEITEAKTLSDLRNVKGNEAAKKFHTVMSEYNKMGEETKKVFWEISVFMVEMIARDHQERTNRWKALDKVRRHMEH
jgi:hypothetical protein